MASKTKLMLMSVAVVVAASFSLHLNAQHYSSNDPADLKARADFVRKLNDHEQQEIKEAVSRMHGMGVSPMIIVTRLVPFGDWDYYYLDGNIIWKPNPGQNFKEVVVPRGFVTDLTSVPRAFWQVMRPEGRYAYAAVVHDYLYWTQERSREEADLIFRYAMQDSKVDPRKADAIYGMVRKFGDASWKDNARLKANGEKRIMRALPHDHTISWGSWKTTPGVFE
ncbi:MULTISPECIES: DUF1353 domain-containing protein [unclassified Pseudoxanthomonas]|uniref:DUF1353 domain-containing protein n=1 Tax=unclassified Pseudoxanthomonas TaxID=2645906 RepID=UPI00307D1116